jgi:hypothetical protein
MATGDVSGMGNKSLSPVAVLPVRGTTDGNTTELWKTGQTTSYADADDGDLQVGVAWPDPRFTDNGDGTITDNLTGLMWVQDATCLGLVTWQEALIAADRFNDNSALFECENYTAAYTDWRLPNRKEMFSLPDFSQDHPALQTGHPFQQVNINTSYWTSTANAANEERAWWCDLRTGEVGHDYKVNARRMMPVR